MHVSLAMAMTLTNYSERTLWRLASEKHWTKRKSQGRVMIPLADILPFCCVSLEAEDLPVLTQADTRIGSTQDAEAQCQMALIFLSQDQYESGTYWLKRAVAAGHADAMNLLASCYINGDGIQRNPSEGLRLLSMAAKLGHRISKQQIQTIHAQSAPNKW